MIYSSICDVIMTSDFDFLNNFGSVNDFTIDSPFLTD